jgi:hypothetical protein
MIALLTPAQTSRLRSPSSIGNWTQNEMTGLSEWHHVLHRGGLPASTTVVARHACATLRPTLLGVAVGYRCWLALLLCDGEVIVRCCVKDTKVTIDD